MNNSLTTVSCPACGQTAYAASALYQLTTYTKLGHAYSSSGHQHDQKIVKQSYIAEKLPPPKIPESRYGCGWLALFAFLGYGAITVFAPYVRINVVLVPEYQILPYLLYILMCAILPIALVALIKRLELRSKKYKRLEKKVEQRTQMYHTLYVCTVGTHPIYVWSEMNRQIIVELERAKELYS